LAVQLKIKLVMKWKNNPSEKALLVWALVKAAAVMANRG